MISEHRIINERCNIPIKQNWASSCSKISPKGEYSLKQNFFDPSKSSPPNEFMLKLQMRMSIYNSAVCEDIIDNKREIE
jgi:hypothetical protein